MVPTACKNVTAPRTVTVILSQATARKAAQPDGRGSLAKFTWATTRPPPRLPPPTSPSARMAILVKTVPKSVTARMVMPATRYQENAHLPARRATPDQHAQSAYQDAMAATATSPATVGMGMKTAGRTGDVTMAALLGGRETTASKGALAIRMAPTVPTRAIALPTALPATPSRESATYVKKAFGDHRARKRAVQAPMAVTVLRAASAFTTRLAILSTVYASARVDTGVPCATSRYPRCI